MERVIPLREEDWATLREIRLAALKHDPGAFGSTLDREQGYDQETWCSRLGASRWFMALDGGQPCGIVAGRDADRSDERELISLWVDPGHRGRGLARLLVEAVIGWARLQGARRLLLWVVDENDGAQRLYARTGFRPTGRHKLVPRDPPLPELEMALDL